MDTPGPGASRISRRVELYCLDCRSFIPVEYDLDLATRTVHPKPPAARHERLRDVVSVHCPCGCSAPINFVVTFPANEEDDAFGSKQAFAEACERSLAAVAEHAKR